MTKIRRRFTGLACLATVLALATAACSGGGQQAGNSQVTMSLRYAGGTAAPDASEAFYTSLPSVLGFWKDQGLNVTQINLNGAGEALQALQAGQADVADPGTNGVLPLIQKNVGIIGFYATGPAQIFFPAVLPGSPIKTVSELAGQTIGVPSLDSASVPVAQSYLGSAGGNPSTLKFLAVGTGSDAMVALQEKRVAALMLWDGPYALIESSGQKLRLLTDNQTGDDAGYSAILVANKADLSGAKRNAYIAFARGIAESLVFMKANPTCGIYAHWQAFPASRPSGMTTQQALQQALTIWNAKVPHVQPVDGLYGYSSPQTVTAQINFEENGAVIKPGLTASDVADWSLIKSINDFNVAKIQALATACNYPWAPKK